MSALRADSPHPFRLQQAPQPRTRTNKNILTDDIVTLTTQAEEDIPDESSSSYIEMLLQLDKIPKLHNLLASASTWLLLAGYLVLPGTFTSIRNSRALAEGSAGKAGKVVVKAVQNVPLLAVAAICCACGATGMFCLSWRWQVNYIWLLNRIILPGLLNSAAGLMTTVINIYTARSGFWSITAIVTAAVTGAFTTLMIGLFLLYDTYLLYKVKKEHELKLASQRGRSLSSVIR